MQYKKSWYAVSISAIKSGTPEVHNVAVALTAISEEEANELAMKAALRKYPIADGFEGQKYSVLRIPIKNWELE